MMSTGQSFTAWLLVMVPQTLAVPIRPRAWNKPSQRVVGTVYSLVLNDLHILSHLIFTTGQWVDSPISSIFTFKRNEVQRSSVTCPPWAFVTRCLWLSSEMLHAAPSAGLELIKEDRIAPRLVSENILSSKTPLGKG